MGRKATFILFFLCFPWAMYILGPQDFFILSLFTRLINGDGAGWRDGILEEVLFKALCGGLFLFFSWMKLDDMLRFWLYMMSALEVFFFTFFSQQLYSRIFIGWVGGYPKKSSEKVLHVGILLLLVLFFFPRSSPSRIPEMVRGVVRRFFHGYI